MKSLKILVAIGVVVIIGGIAVFAYTNGTRPTNHQKVNDNLLKQATLSNTDNLSSNNMPITTPMNVTPSKIDIGNGMYIPQGTYEAPIPLADGKMHTNYLITGMITSQQNIPVYNNILEGNGPVKYYPAGTNLLVIGYVDGYFILGSAAGDVDGLGFKTDTFVNAKNMTLIPNESNFAPLTLGNMPYIVQFLPNANTPVIKLYEYPTDLSKVVGEINPATMISSNPADNTAKIINTANKMNDVVYKGQQGWMLTSAPIPSKYIGAADNTSGYGSNNDATS
ncbi:MAG: hypothetical protein ACRCYC_06250 [Paraclostridium sp.]|uniref:hypothetical protein n=1 Tax=Paraclostridium sp. TaxID=2023273 RepID=UPI003F2CF89D